MQATIEPITERFKGHKPLREICNELGCGFDHLNDLRLKGFLEGLQTHKGFETNVEAVYRAWQRRAMETTSKRGGVTPTKTTTKTQTRRERAEQAAAAMGCEIKK